MVLSLGTRVKIVDDVGKTDSALIGKTGVVINYKWNKYRQEKTLPVVRLSSGVVVSGLGLWFERCPLYAEVIHKLTHVQIQQLLKDTFGETNARYHTLDELPFYKLEALIE